MGDMCRICMTLKKELVRLVNENTNKLERSGEKFEDCFGIKVTEVPYCRKICRNCELQLIDFYYFKQQAVRTHNYLLDKGPDVLGEAPEIKEESPEIGDSDEGQSSDVEFFNLEYLDEEAVHVEMLNFPLPKIETQSGGDNIEIKQEIVENENSMDNPQSEDFDNYSGLGEVELLENFDVESQDECVSKNNEEQKEDSADSEKEPRDESQSSPKRKILKISNESVQNKNSKHKCTECGKVFGHYKPFSEHIKTHRKSLEKRDGDPIKEKRVKQRLDEEDELFIPQVKRKRKKERPKKYNFRCEYCKKPFMSEDTFQAHLRAHMGLPRYSCDICGKGFKEKNKFEYHMKNHKGERDWKCSVCEKAFLIEWDLELHMRTHTDYRPYVCEICGKAFRVICHLTEHRETHNDKNEFECEICGAKLHTRKTLRGHMASAHGQGKIRHCPICEQSFVRNHRLRDHIARYHPEMLLEAKN